MWILFMICLFFPFWMGSTCFSVDKWSVPNLHHHKPPFQPYSNQAKCIAFLSSQTAFSIMLQSSKINQRLHVSWHYTIQIDEAHRQNSITLAWESLVLHNSRHHKVFETYITPLIIIMLAAEREQDMHSMKGLPRVGIVRFGCLWLRRWKMIQSIWLIGW